MLRLTWLSVSILALSLAFACSVQGPPDFIHDECGTDEVELALAEGVVALRMIVGGSGSSADQWLVRADGTVEHRNPFERAEPEILVHPGGAEAVADLQRRIELTTLDRQPMGCYVQPATTEEPTGEGELHEVDVRIDGNVLVYITDGIGAPDVLFQVMAMIDAFIAETRRPEV